MDSGQDYYTLLGVPRDATPEQLRRAYRKRAKRLHPDHNTRPKDTELFLELRQGYEILSDPDLRSTYDAELGIAKVKVPARDLIRYELSQGRQALAALDEPQVHYVLVDIFPDPQAEVIRPSINFCMVIDRSTSMRGVRLDSVRSACLSILKSLEDRDTAAIVAFSDRADVILEPHDARDHSVARARLSMLQSGGGTEIAQGLGKGLELVRQNFSADGVNHIVLLTDGRTYGDEDQCRAMARQAAEEGITINAVGIGIDWSDRFLDDLARTTGGSVIFLDSPQSVGILLQKIFTSLARVVATSVHLDADLAKQVRLRSAFRLFPEPLPLGDTFPLTLGHLTKDGMVRTILDLVVDPIEETQEFPLGNLSIHGDLIGVEDKTQATEVGMMIPVTGTGDRQPPPPEIVSAMGAWTLHRIAERAREEAEHGQVEQAARRLERLATQLLASGERKLAKAALREAEHLQLSSKLSKEGEKALKYGTRALMLQAPR